MTTQFTKKEAKVLAELLDGNYDEIMNSSELNHDQHVILLNKLINLAGDLV